MVAIGDLFATPLGLAGLAAAVPILLLYLVKPDPEQLSLPTVRFLADESSKESANPVLKRLRRDLLLLVQLLAVAALATALATPFTLVTESQATEETVIVVDASASMATMAGDGTRFERAVAAARESVAGATSVVVAGSSTEIVRRRAPPADARATISGIRRTDAAADLGAAITRATAIADENARIVVVSDFAGEGWESAVQTARARDYRVALRQFDGGGAANVGITDVSFSGGTVRVTVTNTGDEPAERTVTLGGDARDVVLDPGRVTTATLPLPAGGGPVRLSPGDDVSVDDTAYVAAPAERQVDVLLVTNDENRYLATALRVNDAVALTVANPPAPEASPADHDVVIFSNVDPDRLLGGTVQGAEATLANGGGVAIQSQRRLGAIDYGDLSLLEAGEVGRTPTVRVTGESPLTRDITFPPPEEYVTGSLRDGRTLVAADDDPLIATGERNGGRLLHYGYIADASAFTFNYQYPVFWQRAVFYLADRHPPATRSRRTGDRLEFANATRVETPTGPVTGTAVTMDRAGWYETADRRYGASLLSSRESAVQGASLSGDDAPISAEAEDRLVRRSMAHWAALLALLVGIVELGVLRRRGDL